MLQLNSNRGLEITITQDEEIATKDDLTCPVRCRIDGNIIKESYGNDSKTSHFNYCIGKNRYLRVG